MISEALTKTQQANNLRAFIQRLRDSNSKQCTLVLRSKIDSDEYCVLGHGLECFREKTGIGQWINEVDFWFFQIGGPGDNNTAARFDDRICNYYGMTQDDSRTLYHMNDNQKKSLSEIADWLETNVLSKLV